MRSSRVRIRFADTGQWVNGLYVQDTWNLSQRLTLDLGLRWESATVPTEVNGKVANLDTIRDTEVRIGNPLFRNPSKKNFMPRIGLAWAVFGSGRTVVRSGYGIFPDLILSQFILSSGVRNPPFFQRGQTRDVGPGDFPDGGFNVLVNSSSPDAEIERIEPEPNQPYVQQWNLNVEQLLDANTTFRVGYVGSHGLYLSSVVADANLVEPILQLDGRLFFPADTERLNPAWVSIRNRTLIRTPFIMASTRSFVAVDEGRAGTTLIQLLEEYRRQLKLLQLQRIDKRKVIAAERESAIQPRALESRHPPLLCGERDWDLPCGRFGVAEACGRWQVSPIVTYASGPPFSVRLDYDAARTQSDNDDWRSGQGRTWRPGRLILLLAITRDGLT